MTAASTAAGAINITQLSCDSSPEFVGIKNFGSSGQSLSNFYLQSDPIHAHGIETYWTNAGSGVAPDPTYDQVDGDVVITTNGGEYTVNGDAYVAE